MKRIWRIVTVTAVLAVAVLALGLLAVSQLSGIPIFGPCAHELVARFPDDGRGEVVVYVTGCGATTPFVTSAAFGSKNASFDPETYNDFFRIKGRGPVEIRWPQGFLDGTSRLEVVYPKGVEILRQAVRWDGTMISYQEK